VGRISLSVVLALTTSSIATAQGVPVTWARQHDAETCADETRILRQVSRLLARGEHIVGDARRVHGTVTRNESGFVATLSLEEHGRHIGVRVLRAPRCSMLEEQVVFVTYLLLSAPESELNVSSEGVAAPVSPESAPPEPPVVEAPSTAPEGAPPSPQETETETETVAVEAADPDPEPVIEVAREEMVRDVPEEREPLPPPRPFVLQLGMIAAADYVPGLWAGGFLGFGWSRNRFRFDVLGGWLPHARQRVDDTTVVRRQVALLELRFCGSGRARGRVIFSGCGAIGLPFESARVETSGSFGQTRIGVYLAPVGVMTVRLSPRFRAGLEMTMPVRLMRRAVSVQNEIGIEEIVHRQGAVAFATSVVVGFEFGKPR
jgi:hypothetical protein